MKKPTGMFVVMAVLVCVVASAASGAGALDGPDLAPAAANIALGKKYTFDKSTQTTAFEPNYEPSTDPDDIIQLTDGKYSSEGGTLLWTQKTTVGWSRIPVVSVTIDLDKIEPIAGISYSTAATAGNVDFPVAISLFVSDDGQAFYYVGDILQLSARHGVPDASVYTIHRFLADNIAAKGRYVRLIIRAYGQFTMCDEIEVYRGSDSLLAQNHQGDPIAKADMTAMEAYSQGMATDAGARIRMRKDLAYMQQRVTASDMESSEKQAVLQRLASLAPRIEELPRIEEKGFRAIIPLNDVHAEILRSNAPILRHRGLPPLLVWQNNQWDPLEPFEAPDSQPASPPAIHVAMMNNEYRSAAFNMTNTTDQPQVVTLHFEGLTAGNDANFITVYQVEFVDTTGRGIVVADPLVPAEKAEDGYVIHVPAGLTRQVWLTFHPQDFKESIYSGRLSLTVAPLDRRLKLPFTLKVYPFTFPERPSLSLYMWDFANNGFGKATDAALTDMQTHYVDTAWGSDDVVPAIAPSDVDEHGNLTALPDFSKFDAWVKLWQGRGIRHYLVGFHGTRKDFAGKALGTPEFHQGVSQWAAAWAKHNLTLGLEPGQVAVNVFDEPTTSEHGLRLTHWANAIKAGTSDILTFINAVDTEEGAPLQDVLPLGDILCPNLGVYAEKLPKSGVTYNALQTMGKKVWFYSCSGPATLMDPYYYYRLQAWYSWKYGATGSGFWSYYDSGGKSAWNPYDTIHASFTPVYIYLDEASVTGGKHWEAVREGVEDYEYLRMLADRVADLKKQGASNQAINDASQLLSTLPEEVVLGDYDQTNKAYKWDMAKDRSLADKARLRILTMLERLQSF